MKLMFETRPELYAGAGHVTPVQRKPEIAPEPLLVGDTASDEGGVSIYGSVIRDGGILRMWYQAYRYCHFLKDSSCVGYAESDDGLVWRKPPLNMVEIEGNKENNLCNLGLHSPSVWIDPAAPASHRYRATGTAFHGQRDCCGDREARVGGYYAAHSADGLHWELDQPEPVWPWADVIASTYHPGQGRGIVALKRTFRVHGEYRRTIWNAYREDGRWTGARSALIPDEFDDVCAAAHGFKNGDYYGMGMMPADAGTVGFLWQFRRHTGTHGCVDISLAYQMDPDGRWIHNFGRENFIGHREVPWAPGGVYSASCPVDVGDEQWLYITGSPRSHGYYSNLTPNENGKYGIDPARVEESRQANEKISAIGVARWPKYQLFGMQADPGGDLNLKDLRVPRNSMLILSYEAKPRGEIRVEVRQQGKPIEGRRFEDSVPLTGLETSGTAAWKDGTLLNVDPALPLHVAFLMKDATLYAYDLVE